MSTTSKSRKKMARRKSISDILAQEDRILASGGAEYTAGQGGKVCLMPVNGEL